jgi:hypothetical protein
MLTGGWICVPLADIQPPVFDPFADPLLPIHITQVVPGIQLRIALKGGHQMVPKETKNGYILVPTDKRRNRRGYEKGVLLGTVTVNNPELGRLSMHVSDEVSKRVYKADVQYTAMAITQRVVAITELVETATAPGSVAFGTKLVGGQLLNPRAKLVHIKF